VEKPQLAELQRPTIRNTTIGCHADKLPPGHNPYSVLFAGISLDPPEAAIKIQSAWSGPYVDRVSPDLFYFRAEVSIPVPISRLSKTGMWLCRVEALVKVVMSSGRRREVVPLESELTFCVSYLRWQQESARERLTDQKIRTSPTSVDSLLFAAP
jgi:hypothetical protein